MKKLLLLTLGLFLTACGESGNETVQTPPKAEASKPIQITITVEQTIDGQSAKSERETLSEG